MYLVDKDIKEMISAGVIGNADAEGVDSVALDIRIKNILADKKTTLTEKELDAGESVMIAAEETLEMPDDLIGIIIQKNSRLRAGLLVNAPVYRPGHKTRIFFSVTNISGDKIEIKAGDSLAAIMFERLENKPETPYEGTFQKEDEYTYLAKYENDWAKRKRETEEKFQSLKDLEKSIYSNVIVLVSVFVGIFSLINFNVTFIKDGAADFVNMLLYNLIHIGGISALVCVVNCILPYGEAKKKAALFIIPLVCFLAAGIMILLG